jgi:DNA mismatch repair protein MutL
MRIAVTNTCRLYVLLALIILRFFMNRIRLLPEQVANQIAAGEVVERPASVVKELVENALDAHATRVTVEIQAGGRSVIRITDDGVGMSRDDALLCLERHATSKIKSADDLSAIRTMGFRGEALPSIASVSRMTIITKEHDAASAAGTEITLHGGRILEVKEAGSAPGTSIEVRNLFFNLPARRKFLRTEETERAHIQHYLSLAALSYPEVAFTFLDGKRLVWQLPQERSGREIADRLPALRERLRGLYGGEVNLFELNCCSPDDTLEPLRLWGFIGAPGVSRATRDEQHLFVNRRPVESRGLNYALLEGYHTALMKGRYPVCCLFLELDPAAVDVNIHPAKREVKFHQEQKVRRFVAESIQKTLLAFHVGSATPGASEKAVIPETKIQPEIFRPSAAPAPDIQSPPQVAARSDELAGLLPPEPQIPPASQPSVELAPATPLVEPRQTPPTFGASPPVPEPVPLLQVPLRLIGVVGQLYVLLESDRGLVLLDQHAAHERILFEQMLRRLEQGHAPSQRLLLPETIELSPRDAQFLRENMDGLARLGVGLSEFGERTFLLDALPPFVKTVDSRRFVLELVDGLKAAGQNVNSWRLGESTVAKTVCRHAVKANDPLAGPELERLVADLRQCAMPYTCPHGRPTLIEMSFRELEKKFGRAQ